MLEMATERIQIREVTADDLADLLTVYTSNPDFVQQNEGSEGEIGRYDLARWQRDWFILQMMPGHHRLGCYLKNAHTPVGVIDFLEENEEDGKPWLGSLVIHKNHQHQGLGTEAFQALHDHLHRETDLTILRTAVKEPNAEGLAFLQQLGFRTIREGSERFAGGIQRFFVMELAL